MKDQEPALGGKETSEVLKYIFRNALFEQGWHQDIESRRPRKHSSRSLQIKRSIMEAVLEQVTLKSESPQLHMFSATNQTTNR